MLAMRGKYNCETCGKAFETLSGKRLHDCPDGARYGGDEPDIDVPVADMDLDGAVELAVEQALVCDVCEEKSDGADDLEHSTTSAGVSFVVTFECDECGAHNENSATLE